jgi:hypothetical protein
MLVGAERPDLDASIGHLRQDVNRAERRISRDGRSQRSSRGATDIPEREQTSLPIIGMLC